MIRNYAKEAYYKIDEMSTKMYEELGSNPIEWKESYDRIVVLPDTKQEYDVFQVKEEGKVELSLHILFETEGNRECTLYVDNVPVGRCTSMGKEATIVSTFYVLPTSAMQLSISGDFSKESVLLHSSVKGSVVLNRQTNKTLYSYTKDKLYTLTLIDHTYYLSSWDRKSSPQLLRLGKTENKVEDCTSFAVSNLANNERICGVFCREGTLYIRDFVTGGEIKIENEKVSICAIVNSFDALTPIFVLYKSESGWKVRGISANSLSVSQAYSCTAQNNLLISTAFTSMVGVSSATADIGINGFLGRTVEGKVYYFMIKDPLLGTDIFLSFCLGVGNTKHIWGVELEDGVHLVAQYEGYVKEYLLTRIGNKAKLTTIGVYPNIQDIVFGSNQKYLIYEDKVISDDE